MSTKWFKLTCDSKELQLLGTLNGGQSFRWKRVIKDSKDEWIGVFSRKLWILRQSDNEILYQVYHTDTKEPIELEETYNKLLTDYFNLHINLSEYYSKWSSEDPNFKKAAETFYGIRILNQEVVENIFSFICSQNNHISRITSMVEKLAQFYGDKICDLNGVTYYSFPEVAKLADKKVEEKLKSNGFGYRAKYIYNSAKFITEGGGQEWLTTLKQMNYEDAKNRLISLHGVGPKVADCICLMSLGHFQAIPVDTHVYQIALKFYIPQLSKQKTVTEKIYKQIGDYFRKLFGPLAGWAHTVLFCADLKKFKHYQENENKSTRCKKLKVN